MNDPFGARATGLVFLGIGLLMLAIAFGALTYGTWFGVRAEKVTGTVTEVVLQH
ncbi:MAG: hypothetical protein ACRDFQ_08955 [Anaerolineales bacterium]